MAGDERRAEVEAVERELREYGDELRRDWSDFDGRSAKQFLYGLADRLRDARGDDEADRLFAMRTSTDPAAQPEAQFALDARSDEQIARLSEELQALVDWFNDAPFLRAERLLYDLYRARSPQDEDHEAQLPCPRCSGQGVEEVPAHGSWEEHGTLYAECRKCNGTGKVPAPSPSRDGTVAVADVAAKLNEMALVDETRDPHDEGYMAAVVEVRDWLAEFARPGPGEQTDHGGDQ